jgi:hypothetical protein
VLQLTFQNYNDLDLLRRALDDMNTQAFDVFSAVSDQPQDETTRTMSSQQYKALYDVAVMGTINAQRMLGKILLAVIENPANAAYAHTSREQWGKPLLTPPEQSVQTV